MKVQTKLSLVMSGLLLVQTRLSLILSGLVLYNVQTKLSLIWSGHYSFFPVADSQFRVTTVGTVCWECVLNGLLANNLAIVSGWTELLLLMVFLMILTGFVACGIGDRCIGVIGVCWSLGCCIGDRYVGVAGVCGLSVLYCIGDRCGDVIGVCGSLMGFVGCVIGDMTGDGIGFGGVCVDVV